MSAYASRIERLRALFDEAKIDGLLISQPESRFYLSGYTGHDLPPRDSAGYLMIGKSGALLLTDPRTSEQAENEAQGLQDGRLLGERPRPASAWSSRSRSWASRSSASSRSTCRTRSGRRSPRRSARRGTRRPTAPRSPGRASSWSRSRIWSTSSGSPRTPPRCRSPGGHRRARRLLHAPGQERAAGRADREGDRPGGRAVPPEPRPHHLVPVDRRQRPELLDAARRADRPPDPGGRADHDRHRRDGERLLLGHDPDGLHRHAERQAARDPRPGPGGPGDWPSATSRTG